MSNVITGRNIDRISFKTTLSMLKLEVNTGMKMSRGRSMMSIVKSSMGLKGNKVKILEQFTEICRLIDEDIWPVGYRFRNRQDEGMIVYDDGTIGPVPKECK